MFERFSDLFRDGLGEVSAVRVTAAVAACALLVALGVCVAIPAHSEPDQGASAETAAPESDGRYAVGAQARAPEEEPQASDAAQGVSEAPAQQAGTAAPPAPDAAVGSAPEPPAEGAAQGVPTTPAPEQRQTAPEAQGTAPAAPAASSSESATGTPTGTPTTPTATEEAPAQVAISDTGALARLVGTPTAEAVSRQFLASGVEGAAGAWCEGAERGTDGIWHLTVHASTVSGVVSYHITFDEAVGLVEFAEGGVL